MLNRIKRTHVVKWAVLFPIMFLFVFGWKITSIFDLILIVSAGLTLFLLLMNHRFTSKDISVRYSKYLIISLIYGMVIAFIHGAYDLNFITRTIRAIINLFGAFSLVIIYKKNDPNHYLRDIVKAIKLCIVIHSVLMIAMYFSSDLRTIVYSFTHNSLSRYSTANGLRIAGLTYGLSQTSLLTMWGTLLSVFDFYMGKNTLRRILTLIVELLIITFSLIICGRTGIVFGIILLPLLLIICKFAKNDKDILRIHHTINFKIVFVVGFTCIFVSYLGTILISYLPEKFFSYTVNHVSEVAELFKTGESSTTQAISEDLLVFPSDPLDFIFGTSSLGRSEENFIEADPGFNKIFNAVGLVGSILYYIPTFFSIYYLATRKSKHIALKSICLFAILCNFILNFKDLSLYVRNQWSVITMLFFLFYFANKEENLSYA